MRYLKPLVEMRCSSRRPVHICALRADMPSLVVAIFKIAHQRKNKPDLSMVGDAHPTKIALLQLVQDVIQRNS